MRIGPPCNHMSLFANILSDTKDIVSSRAFEVDLADPSVALDAKMGSRPTVAYLLSNTCARVATLQRRSEGYELQRFAEIRDETVKGSEKVLSMSVRQTAFQTALADLKKERRFLLGLMPMNTDGIVFDIRRHKIQKNGEWVTPADLDEAYAFLEGVFKESNIEAIKALQSQGLTVDDTRLNGLLPLPSLNVIVIVPEDLRTLQLLNTEFEGRGQIVRVCNLALNLALYAESQKLLTQKPLGLLLFFGLDTLVMLGWSAIDERRLNTIFRVRAVPPTNNRGSVAESSLGRALQDAVRTWYQHCNIKSEEVVNSQLGFYCGDLDGSEMLSNVMQAIVPKTKDAMQQIDLSGLRTKLLTRDKQTLPIDIAALLID